MDTRWLDGLEESARRHLSEAVHRYIRQGARHGVTAGEAVEAWQRLRFLPRVMQDVTGVDTSTTLLGTPVESPVAVAPTTLQRAAHPEGELAMARATAAAGSLMVVSSNAGRSFADIAATGVPWWLQLYVTADRELTYPVLERAVAAGARAVVLTVDTPVVGMKYDDGPRAWDEVPADWVGANFDEVERTAAGYAKATDLGAADVAELARRSGVPVVVKGVLRRDDARRCVDAGASAVWVSNHGGRQLDRTAATAAALPGVVETVGADVEVFVDGGVRSGLDVLAALSLGARGVFLGRLPLWALAHGEAAVLRMHRDLRAELVESLRLAGVRRAGDAPTIGPGTTDLGSDLHKQ